MHKMYQQISVKYTYILKSTGSMIMKDLHIKTPKLYK